MITHMPGFGIKLTFDTHSLQYLDPWVQKAIRQQEKLPASLYKYQLIIRFSEKNTQWRVCSKTAKWRALGYEVFPPVRNVQCGRVERKSDIHNRYDFDRGLINRFKKVGAAFKHLPLMTDSYQRTLLANREYCLIIPVIDRQSVFDLMLKENRLSTLFYIASHRRDLVDLYLAKPEVLNSLANDEKLEGLTFGLQAQLFLIYACSSERLAQALKSYEGQKMLLNHPFRHYLLYRLVRQNMMDKFWILFEKIIDRPLDTLTVEEHEAHLSMCLCYAILQGDRESVQRLLDHPSVNPNQKGENNLWMPVMVALNTPLFAQVLFHEKVNPNVIGGVAEQGGIRQGLLAEHIIENYFLNKGPDPSRHVTLFLQKPTVVLNALNQRQNTILQKIWQYRYHPAFLPFLERWMTDPRCNLMMLNGEDNTIHPFIFKARDISEQFRQSILPILYAADTRWDTHIRGPAASVAQLAATEIPNLALEGMSDRLSREYHQIVRGRRSKFVSSLAQNLAKLFILCNDLRRQSPGVALLPVEILEKIAGIEDYRKEALALSPRAFYPFPLSLGGFHAQYLELRKRARRDANRLASKWIASENKVLENRKKNPSHLKNPKGSEADLSTTLAPKKTRLFRT